MNYTYTVTTTTTTAAPVGAQYNTFQEQLIDEVVSMMGIDRHRLFEHNRTERVKFSRWMVWEIMYAVKGLSLRETGMLFGDHDHSTVSNALDKLAQDIEHKSYLKHCWQIILERMEIDEAVIKEMRKKRHSKKTFVPCQ